MECEFPSVNSNNEEIREIFNNTKTIAIAGLSPNEDKASNMVGKYLKEAGFIIQKKILFWVKKFIEVYLIYLSKLIW